MFGLSEGLIAGISLLIFVVVFSWLILKKG